MNINTIYINDHERVHSKDEDDGTVVLRRDYLLKRLKDQGFTQNLTGIVALGATDAGSLASESTAYAQMVVGNPLLNCKFFLSTYQRRESEGEEDDDDNMEDDQLLVKLKEEKQREKDHARGEATAFVRRNYAMLYGMLSEMQFKPENYGRDELRVDGAIFTQSEAVSLFRGVYSMLTRTKRILNHSRAVQCLDPTNRFKQVHKDNTSVDAEVGIVFEDDDEGRRDFVLGDQFGDRVRSRLNELKGEDWSVLLFDSDGKEITERSSSEEGVNIIPVYNLDPERKVVRTVKKLFMKHLSLPQCKETGKLSSVNEILFDACNF